MRIGESSEAQLDSGTMSHEGEKRTERVRSKLPHGAHVQTKGQCRSALGVDLSAGTLEKQLPLWKRGHGFGGENTMKRKPSKSVP